MWKSSLLQIELAEWNSLPHRSWLNWRRVGISGMQLLRTYTVSQCGWSAGSAVLTQITQINNNNLLYVCIICSTYIVILYHIHTYCIMLYVVYLYIHKITCKL
jgi:hypothetical protein